MRRSVVLGLVLTAVVGIALGNMQLSKNAETIPPNPAIITINM